MGILVVGMEWKETPAFPADCVHTAAEARALLARVGYDAVVAGPHVMDTTLDELVADLAQDPQTPVVLAGDAGERAVAAAWECVTETGEALVRAVARAAEVGRLRRAQARTAREGIDRRDVDRVFRTGSIREMERLMIVDRLQRLNQNRTRSAISLDISVRTLRNKLRQYRETPEPEAVSVEDH